MMIIKRTQRVWAFLTAATLVLMALGSGLFTPLFAHADTDQKAGVTVNFDFDSVKGMNDFADHVWVYQWAAPFGTPNTAYRITPEKKTVTFKPFNNEQTAHFIVFIGDFNGGITVWNRWNEGSQAQTDDITAQPGQSYLVKYDQLKKQGSAPQPAKMSELYTPLFTGGEIERGKTLTLESPTFTDINSAPATPDTLGYAVQGDEKLQATIKDAGVLVVKPKYDAVLGQSQLQVTVTYKDGSTDTVPVNINVKEAQVMDLTYTPQPITVHQGETETLTPKLAGDNTVVPAGTVYTFETLPHASLSIEPSTGVITVAPKNDAQTGTYKLRIKATYKDNLIAQGDATVIIAPQEESSASPSAAWRFSYNKLTVTQNESQSVDVTATLFGKKTSLPHDITFSTGENTHKWVTVDSKTGTVTAKPDEFVAAQDYTFKMLVTHLDDTVTLAPVTITVTKAPAGDLDTTAWKFSYNKLTVAQNESQSVNVTASLFGKKSSLPAGITFTPGADMPSWITVDPKTGEVTANPDEYVAAQDYEFTVVVTHLDGKVTTVPVKITITKADNAPELKSQLWKLSYADTTVQQLKSASVDLTATLFGKERALPRAVTFAKGADMPSWITVDPKTGEVTANPDEYVAAQDHTFTVVVTHLDGEVTTVPVKITITKADNAPELKSQLWKLSYADTTVQQLKTASVDLTATLFGKERALPRAVTFAKG
ncbi:Rib/alpha-like domain-containing protein, partial [Arcanobacterium phocae]|uniref:Rib/alpha-like domain-containing protein n=1 Tax=Arcanobacterium phocae TaxID=131112 RepID=UPI001C0EBE6E